MTMPPLIFFMIACVILAVIFKKYFVILPIVLVFLLYKYISTRSYLGEPFVERD